MKFKLKTNIERPSEKRLDKLWGKIVILRAGNRCEYPGCQKTEYLNPHHIYSRSRKSVRWDTDNGIALCSGHHCLLNESAHKDPNFLRVIKEFYVRMPEFLDKLERRAKTPAKVDRCLIELDLKNELRKIELLTPYRAVDK